MDIKKKLKMALISGASHALKFQRENPNVSEEELIQMVSRESNKILEKINSDD